MPDDPLLSQGLGGLAGNEQPAMPQQQAGGLDLGKLLSVVIPALGAMATTSRWAGPGTAAARGAMGGLEGYAAAQPPRVTPEDRYHQALADHMILEAKQLNQQMQDEEAFKKTLSPEELQKYQTLGKKAYGQQLLAEKTAPAAREYLAKYGKVDPSILEGADPATLSKMMLDVSGARATAMNRPPAKWDLAQRYDDDPKSPTYGRIVQEFYNTENPTQRRPLGIAPPPKASALKTVTLMNPADGKPHVYGIDATGAQVDYGVAPPKGATQDKPGGTIANKTYLNEKGEAPATEELNLPESELVKKGYRAVPNKDADNVRMTRQSLTMLNNMAQTFDTLNVKGKMVGNTGLGGLVGDISALGEKGELKWKQFAADPDLQLAQAQTSDMVAIMRGLGDKGVRAMQAFQGAMDMLKSGKAPYSTVKNYLQQIDKDLRAGAPVELPHVYEDYEALPGARKMGETTAAGTAKATHAYNPATGKIEPIE